MFSQNNSLLFITKVCLNLDCRDILYCQCVLTISEYLWNTVLPSSTLFPSCWFFRTSFILIQTNVHLLNISATRQTCSNHNCHFHHNRQWHSWLQIMRTFILLHSPKSHCYDLYQFMPRFCLYEFKKRGMDRCLYTMYN